MMDLDELKQKWAENDRKLDLSLRLNRQLLLATKLGRVRSPLQRLAFFLGLEAAIGLAVAVGLGQFMYDHIATPRFVVPAAALHVWVIANIAAAIRLMVVTLHIDYDQPVAAIQKQLERLRVQRIQITKWELLTGQLVWWVPFLIVALKGFFGLDAYQLFGTRVLAVNLLFGLAVIPLAIWLSKRLANRMDHSPLIQRLMRVLAGYDLTAATDFLAKLSEFEDREPETIG